MLNAVYQEKNKSFPLINANTHEKFSHFQFANAFADTTFSLLYSWGEKFDYGYHLYDDVMAITGIDINGKRGFSLIRSKPEISIDTAFRRLCQYCSDIGIMPVFEYISENELNDYIHAVNGIGRKIEFSYQEKYSDYIYETTEFISMVGNRNKTKRGGYNFLERYYPDIKYISYKPQMYNDVMEIFNSWCSTHECEKCYYGCERKAFERFMEIYNDKFHKIGISYVGNRPLSFAVCEQINEYTMSYYFQKNAKRIRGLTYWLNRHMALEHENIKYINLGEDMGIQGLITDKKLLHPCKIVKKYTAVVI
ncbi:MAG: phosphatidylglycerol lysyltransferase domain-containing protein [Ruminococcus sp.]